MSILIHDLNFIDDLDVYLSVCIRLIIKKLMVPFCNSLSGCHMFKKTIFLTSMVTFGVSLAVSSATAKESQILTCLDDGTTPSEFAITLEQIRSRPIVYQASAKSSSGASTKADHVVIDLMVWFQPAYGTKVGLQTAHARFSEMVDGLNAAFLASDVNASVRLVNAEPLRNVAEDLSLQEAVERFQTVLLDPNDPYYEYIQYAAYAPDVALYVRDYRDSEQDNASLGSGDIEGEVSVVRDRYDGQSTEFENEANAIFRHVIGHKFGGDHDQASIDADKIFTYTSDPDARATTCDGGKETIMWSRYDKNNSISLFSNPTIERGGEFCGELGKADNARVLNANASLTGSRREAPASYGAISFSQADYSVNESDGTASITLTRAGSLSGKSTVELAVLDDSAEVGSDIASASAIQLVTFAEGEGSVSVDIALVSDSVAEPLESANLMLRYPFAATAASAQATLTIEESVAVTPTPTPGEITVSVSEAKVEGEDVVVTLDRSNGSDGEISLTVATSLMTATDSLAAASADDFTAQTAEVVFADGEISKTVNISTTDDELVEETEGFTVIVTNDQSIVINNSQSTAQILDNDEEATPEPEPAPAPIPAPPPAESKSSGGGGSFGWLSVLLAGLVFRKIK